MANEQRLIDANVLADDVELSKHNNPHPPGMVRVNHRNEHDHFLKMIYDAPAVDAVEVVRCKDCKHCIRLSHIDPDEVRCGKLQSDYIKPNDFCSYGERREGE